MADTSDREIVYIYGGIDQGQDRARSNDAKERRERERVNQSHV
jgi:hypothetical protein